jgi:predicted nucleotidyltransferase
MSFLLKLSPTLRTIRPHQRPVFCRNQHVQRMFKTSVQTVDDIRQQTAILQNDPECEPISWVGLFGSFARSTQSSESDVDLIIGYKPGTEADKIYLAAGNLVDNAEEAFGRQAELLHIIRQEVSTYLLLEALLTCVTVHGSEEWPRRLQEQAREYLDDGYRRLEDSYSSLLTIHDLVAKTDRQVQNTTISLIAVFCLKS